MAEQRTVDTVKLSKGGEYARVPARLKLFREDTANGLIETSPTFHDNGVVMFTARIVKDKSDPNSAEATGHSYGKSTGVKEFEKLETIAVGRALALLGYLASGEVASFEEIEAWNAEKKQQHEKAVMETIENMNSATTLPELRKVFMESNLMSDEDIIVAKDIRKAELTDAELNPSTESNDG